MFAVSEEVLLLILIFKYPGRRVCKHNPLKMLKLRYFLQLFTLCIYNFRYITSDKSKKRIIQNVITRK